MPTISAFYGILIRMFWDDHAPPHFHVIYAQHKAEIEIETLEILGGRLPPQAKRLVKTWARQHKTELLNAWSLCRKHETPEQIDPLD
ncbi:MAG: DUF4160 domain-containing protein [Alphaproteobacteria bacterium]|nr:DUF4160 domain-containing protein [Alphaproteobacteria bacterium]